VETAGWVTVKGPGIKPPPLNPIADQPMYEQRLAFWDAAAERAG
jgi:hypothetical protein